MPSDMDLNDAVDPSGRAARFSEQQLPAEAGSSVGALKP
jgi:hypothetical protein